MTTRRASPYRLVSPVAAEDELHAAVARALDTLLLPPAMWTTFPAGNVPLPPQYAAKLSRVGLKRGWPDILVQYRVMHGIELKRPGGVLSKTRVGRTRRGAMRVLVGQEDVFPCLEAAGMQIAVCRSVDAVLAQLAAWGVPLRVHRVQLQGRAA